MTERIALIMSRAADIGVLRRTLAHECIAFDALDAARPEIDLIVADPIMIERHAVLIRGWRREADPMILPVLLASPARFLERASRHLGTLADDIVAMPVSRIELSTRIDNLLRLRALSSRQTEAVRQAERGLAGTERALKALSATNEQVIRAEDRDTLVERVCQALADEGDYALAWIGAVENDAERAIRPIAGAGPRRGYVDDLPLSWGDRPTGRGPVGSAVREGRIQLANDVQTDPAMLPWRARAAQFGIRAVAALPLRIDGDIHYVLAIYAEEPDAFDDAECRLLNRLRDHLAHGLAALEEKARRIASEQRAVRIAHHDSLTGLANRQSALVRLHQRIDDNDGQQPVALIFIDLDGFKSINDVLGHDRGDEVLTKVASRLSKFVGDTDMVARQGGDEFLVIVAKQDNDSIYRTARLLARRLVQAMAKPIEIGEARYRLSASAGISVYPTDAADPSRLLACADRAMYEAKKAGGNHYRFFSADLARRERRRLNIEQQLSEALENDQLDLAFHPIVNLDDERIVGVESLLRWTLPDGHPISPDEFIPIAEETGLILPISDWVFERTIAALARWRQRGYAIRASVNLSARQIWKRRLVIDLTEVMARHGLNPRCVDLELTETDLMSDIGRMERVVQQLSEAGFAISIDDFGTGYSSLARLMELPVDTLKIDKSFLANVPARADATAVVRTIVSLADNLGMNVVAEGIEQADQQRFLRAIGCHWGQGFYFWKPMPEADLIAALTSG